MNHDQSTMSKHTQACDLAHQLFLPSYALVLEDAEPERLYRELEKKGYIWTGSTWQLAQATDSTG